MPEQGPWDGVGRTPTAEQKRLSRKRTWREHAGFETLVNTGGSSRQRGDRPWECSCRRFSEHSGEEGGTILPGDVQWSRQQQAGCKQSRSAGAGAACVNWLYLCSSVAALSVEDAPAQTHGLVSLAWLWVLQPFISWVYFPLGGGFHTGTTRGLSAGGFGVIAVLKKTVKVSMGGHWQRLGSGRRDVSPVRGELMLQAGLGCLALAGVEGSCRAHCSSGFQPVCTAGGDIVWDCTGRM